MRIFKEKTKFSKAEQLENEKAIETLMRYSSVMTSGNVFQSNLNIAADYLRLYLGDHSNIYQSFKNIDIRRQIGAVLVENLMKANELLQAGAQFISDNGVYKNLQLQLLQVQIKETKRKITYAVLGAIGGALLTNAKDILSYFLS